MVNFFELDFPVVEVEEEDDDDVDDALVDVHCLCTTTSSLEILFLSFETRKSNASALTNLFSPALKKSFRCPSE